MTNRILAMSTMYVSALLAACTIGSAKEPVHRRRPMSTKEPDGSRFGMLVATRSWPASDHHQRTSACGTDSL